MEAFVAQWFKSITPELQKRLLLTFPEIGERMMLNGHLFLSDKVTKKVNAVVVYLYLWTRNWHFLVRFFAC